MLQPKILQSNARELLQGSGGDNDGEPPLAWFRLYTCAGYATVESKTRVLVVTYVLDSTGPLFMKYIGCWTAA